MATVPILGIFTITSILWSAAPHAQYDPPPAAGPYFRDGAETIFRVRFDETTKTFSLFDDASGRFGPGSAAGSHKSLQTSQATLDLADTTVAGSGPTGPSVTLNLAMSVKPQAGNRSFLVEVAASDDLGNEEDFAVGGRLTVSLKKGSAANPVER